MTASVGDLQRWNEVPEMESECLFRTVFVLDKKFKVKWLLFFFLTCVETPKFAHAGVLVCCVIAGPAANTLPLGKLQHKGTYRFIKRPRTPLGSGWISQLWKKGLRAGSHTIQGWTFSDAFVPKMEWQMCFCTIHLYFWWRRKLKYD